MNTIPKHRVERSETPWWWFGQPWQRADMSTSPAEEDLPPDNDDEPYAEPEPAEDDEPAESEKSWAHVS
jgi:hypothetical protein